MLFYQVSVAYTDVNDKGKVEDVKKNYIIQAETYGDAETRAYEMIANGKSDFVISKILKPRISEIFNEQLDDIWFKSKVQYITFDEKSQKEKRVNYTMLVNATDIRHAHDLLKENLGSVQDYVIAGLNIVAIEEIIRIDKKPDDSVVSFKLLSN